MDEHIKLSLIRCNKMFNKITLHFNWLLNQMVEHILIHYILLRGVPNLIQNDWAISIIWLRYIMAKKKKENPLDFTVSINSTCHNTSSNVDVRNK